VPVPQRARRPYQRHRTNQLRIEGVRELGPGRHRLGPDHIEIGSFVALAAMTGGDLRIRDVIPEDLRMIRLAYRRLGVETMLDGTTLVVPGPQELQVAADADGAIPKVDDAPWPGFPADLTRSRWCWRPRAAGRSSSTRSCSRAASFSWTASSRWARASCCAIRTGRWWSVPPSCGARRWCPRHPRGHGAHRRALCARGTSSIMNAHQVDRGYERIDERLRSLGARITREPGV